MIEINDDTKFYKIKYMDGKRLKIVDDVISIEQVFGDIKRIYSICGIHPLFGATYCDKCIEENNNDGCGKHFVVHEIKTCGDVTIANTLNGSVAITDDWEVIE